MKSRARKLTQAERIMFHEILRARKIGIALIDLYDLYAESAQSLWDHIPFTTREMRALPRHFRRAARAALCLNIPAEYVLHGE